MYTKPSASPLGKKVVTKRIVLFFALTQLVICATALGDLINITGAAQQVGGGVGYNDSDGVSHDDPDQFVPLVPQGPTDAYLNLSVANYGVSILASLDSLFSEDEIVAGGSASASAVWGTQPLGASDNHGGGGSTFTLSFTKDSSPAYFYINGKIDLRIEGDPGRHPDDVFAYVRLSSDDGGGVTTIWEEAADGGNGDISLHVAHGLWLETGKTYLLEAYEQAAAGIIIEDSTASQSNIASFSFTATASAVSVDIVPDTISTKTKSITCNIWPPNGYDVTQIDQGSIRLNDEIQPVRISVRQHQQTLIVKFPTSQLLLEPGTLDLTVIGSLTDGTTFADSDTVEVIERGGKPN
jgi:hypothetical protein